MTYLVISDNLDIHFLWLGN